MNRLSGWTLIELALVISLMAIVSTVTLRLYADPLTFKHYKFSQQLIEGIHQAKMVILFSDEKVHMTMVDNYLVFTTSGAIQKTWSVFLPEDIQHPSLAFPLVFGEAEPYHQVSFITRHHEIVIEPRTIYAYQITKTP